MHLTEDSQSLTTLFLPLFLSSLASVRGQHCPECLCPTVGCRWCQLLCLPHLLVCFSLHECWQRKATAAQDTGEETHLQVQVREERKPSAVPAGRGPAGTRLKAGRASACWTLLLPRTHLCQELAQSSLGEVDLVLDWPWPVASRIQRCHLPLDWTF